MRNARLLCWLPLVAACGGGDASVSIVFPNDVARNAIRRLRIEAYDPEAGSGPASARDCGDFIGKAKDGDDPLGAPVRADYQCVETAANKCEGGWFGGREDLKIPRGRRIIYALAFATTDEGATPILEGCTDRFDSDGGGDESNDVPIELMLVIPDNARMVKSAGDRQVGRSGDELYVPLEVRVQADSPDGTGGTYDIPGVAIRFTSDTDGFELTSGDDPAGHQTFTNDTGRASVAVRLPTNAGSGEITAFAAALEDDSGDIGRSDVIFSVSVTDPVTFPVKDVLSSGTNTLPIAAALGDLDGAGGLDLAVLNCQGNRENCTSGHGAVTPLGNSQLVVVANVGQPASRRQLTSPTNLGVLPADLVIDDVRPPAGTQEIVLLNGRRGDCQARTCPSVGECKCYGRAPGAPCPCEGAEILVLEAASGVDVQMTGRHTMTGSNAVSLSTFESSDTGAYRGVAMVAQGRSVDERPCSRANRCLPYQSPSCETNPEDCGCPPAERCECPDCTSTNEPGVCVARDKMLDVLIYRTAQTQQGLYNKNGCQMRELLCDNQNPQTSECACLDSFRGNRCTANDGCNCKVPDRAYIGDTDAPVLPYAVVAAPFKEDTSWDVVVPSVGGLELVEATGGSFVWRTEPIINAPVHEAVAVDLDFASEVRTTMNPPPDVVWFAREACLEGANFNQSCRIWRELPEGVESRGCLGVYFTDGADSIFTLRTPSVGGCRRHQLEFEPHGMCSGEFNGDGHIDIALASRDIGSVAIFSGDGRGGLLDPPALETLPGAAGGPIACGDIDGDGLDDIVVVNGDSGAIYVLGTSN